MQATLTLAPSGVGGIHTGLAAVLFCLLHTQLQDFANKLRS